MGKKKDKQDEGDDDMGGGDMDEDAPDEDLYGPLGGIKKDDPDEVKLWRPSRATAPYVSHIPHFVRHAPTIKNPTTIGQAMAK